MFSKSCEYAIRSVIYIAAVSSQEKKVSIDDICAHVEAPKHFTAKILQILSRKKIVSSQKGVNGGFYVDKNQVGETLIQVVSAIDGNVLFTGCGLGLKACSEKEPCPLHDKFKGIRAEIKKMLDEATIESMAGKLRAGSGFLVREKK